MTGRQLKRNVDWPARPTFYALAELVETILDGAEFERVCVLHDGEYVDMFTDALAHMEGLPLNERATKILRNEYLAHNPDTALETLPTVAGKAVLFHRRVWP